LRDGHHLVRRDTVTGVITRGDTTVLALPTTEYIIVDTTHGCRRLADRGPA